LPLPLLQSAVISVWFRGRRRTRDLYTVWRESIPKLVETRVTPGSQAAA
jgi:hypothetical protein